MARSKRKLDPKRPAPTLARQPLPLQPISPEWTDRLVAFVAARGATLLIGAAVVALTVVAYLPAIGGGFVWDDRQYVIYNPTLQSLSGLWKIWIDPLSVPQYYPLVYTSFWIEYQLFGLNPLSYHLVNVCLHIANALLLWRVLLRLEVPGAGLAAAVFAVHPVHVESVAWVTERKNVLSGFFYLLALLYYLRFALPTAARRRAWTLYAFAIVLFTLALLSKTVTCTLPVTILLVLWWKLGRIGWREVLPLAPLFLLAAGFGGITAWVEKHHVGAEGVQWSLSVVERCLIAGRALCFYAGKLLWPYPIMFQYPRWRIDAGAWWQYLYPLAAVAAVAGLWALRRRLGRGPLVAVLFFAVTVAPALGFVNFFWMRFSFVGDHFQYHASVGIIALVAAALTWAVTRLRWSQVTIGAGAGVILVVLAAATWSQAHIYKDLETFYREILARNPDAWMPHNNLGQMLENQGKIEEAHRHFVEVLRLFPDYAEGHNNLAVTLAKLGKPDEALAHYTEAVRLLPDYADGNYNLAQMLARRGRLDEAIAHYQASIRARPGFPFAHGNLGKALASQGRIDEAIPHFRQAIRLKPAYAQAHFNLADALEQQGKLSEAIEHYAAAVRYDAGFAAARERLAAAKVRVGTP